MPPPAAPARTRFPAPTDPVHPAHSTALRDRLVDVETPEHVAIGYELADLGSRFTALLIDKILQVTVMLGVLVVLMLVQSLAGGGSDPFEGVWMAITIAIAFLVQWGYFVLYEGLRDGQTPGKRRMGIRVVQDGGYPVTLQGAAVRNLLRVVDVQPLVS
jgi:uncharacterized RDD family membrane protein YckC